MKYEMPLTGLNNRTLPLWSSFALLTTCVLRHASCVTTVWILLIIPLFFLLFLVKIFLKIHFHLSSHLEVKLYMFSFILVLPDPQQIRYCCFKHSCFDLPVYLQMSLLISICISDLLSGLWVHFFLFLNIL